MSGSARATGAQPDGPVPQAAPVPHIASAPHIALILPLNSEAFGRAAEAVRAGFFAAAGMQPHGLPVRVYASANESRDIAALYRQAVADGARAVAGPLTRDGVAALAAQPDIPVPTLALNVAEAGGADKLYFFGLPAEDEARQVAQTAQEEKLRNAIVVHGGDPLSLRLAQAFAAEWKARGGRVAAEIAYRGDPDAFADLPAAQDTFVFLAAEAETARLIRPYLDAALPVFATSQVFNGNADALTNFDLKDIRFVDMPWMLQPDHAAVMVYPRPDPPPGPSRERLYALGIDAERLLQAMLDGDVRAALPLDGVTGRIRLEGRQFRREAIPAVFKQGMGLTPEAAAALAAQQAAERAAAASGIPASAPASAVSAP